MWVTDIEHNVGLFVHATLSNPSVSLPAKYVSAHTDIVPYKDLYAAYAEVSGKRVAYLECSPEQAEYILGIHGKELARQFKLNGVAPDWGKAHKGDVVTAKELGIEGQLLGLKQSLEANKEKL